MLQPETYINTGKLTGSSSEYLQLGGIFPLPFFLFTVDKSEAFPGRTTHSVLSPVSSLAEVGWPIKGGLQEQQGTLGDGILNTGCFTVIYTVRTTDSRSLCGREGISPRETSWERLELPRGGRRTGRWGRGCGPESV